MGYTQFTKDLVLKGISSFGAPVSLAIDLGSQNDYTTPNTDKPPFISEWYRQLGVDSYKCIDLAGDNNAIRLDLSQPMTHLDPLFPTELLVDAGTSEHVISSDKFDTVSFHEGHINSVYPSADIIPTEESIKWGYYQCWRNKHHLLITGGIMVNENPLTGHWPQHSYSFLGSNFYQELSMIAGYEIIEAGVHFACGNTVDGGNLYSILRKTNDIFPSFTEFYAHLPVYRS